MAKSSKKLTGNATKPITDFFKPKSLSQSSSLATVASNSTGPSSEATVSSIASSQTVLSQSSSSTHPTRVTHMQVKLQSHVSEDTTSLRKGLPSPTKPMVQTVGSSTSSLKRSRSPDTQPPGLSPLPLRRFQKPLPEPCNSPARRKAKFDTDSEREQDSVVHVKRMQTPQSKKRRISSPGPSSLHSSSSLVPSSQSDEEELAPSRSKARSTDVKAVDHWRKETLPHSPDVDSDDDRAAQTEIDPLLSSSPLTSRFTSPLTEPEHDTNLQRPTPASPFSPGFGHIPTPPYTDRHSNDAPMPPSPIALDPATKAAQIIADIKARAYAATLLSPESTPSLEFKDELSDSSDDEMLPFVPVPAKEKSKTKPSVDNVDSTIMTRPTRYPLRDRTSSPAIGEGESLEQSSRGLRTMPAVFFNGAHKKGKGAAKKKPAFNPLDNFLKEKRQAEKGGKGAEAFRCAESLASMQGKNNLFDEMADEQAESAAFQAVKERDQWLNTPLSPDNSFTSLGAITLVEEDRRRLFGDNGGKAIIGILESDRVLKDQERAHKKFKGVPFWTTQDSVGMLVDETFPTFQYEGKDSILQLFKSALDRGGTSHKLHSCLTPGTSALSTSDAPIHAAAFRALLRLYSSKPNPPCGVTLSCILGALHRLGAVSSPMSSIGWATESSVHPPSIDSTSREGALYRLVELVASCARSQQLVVEDIPDLVAALVLLIATDPSTSLPLQRDITTVINQICNSIGPEGEVFSEIEARICSKVLNCISTCQPINIPAFLFGCRHRSLLANCPAQYSDLPPISEILNALLLTSSDQSGIFDLHDETDYVNLGFYVYILSVALSNVKGWALEECEESRSKPLGRHSPNKLGSGEDKPKTPLQVLLLRACIRASVIPALRTWTVLGPRQLLRHCLCGYITNVMPG
ncbi:uncharacterized protein LACBIDRAFT_296212 [Laccaria bicolor S238N-H82]|uniref:Predicted protein n=1 Tax=Laccaria bicolor (strain S238N-H82 / ATCC MYA-4686) TaxID=486041 RepID=B0D887_LACBS|nr:uncharacterized protein LACBIDRAFT_296212 [Laccaria bicolor S238N-H82]EDR08791.1 predicted protein [Laccaria bicolor S238N-H82]|eukprot:XP_001880104.1 predicted protein [Laccaria bicolor S238N-H82]